MPIIRTSLGPDDVYFGCLEQSVKKLEERKKRSVKMKKTEESHRKREASENRGEREKRKKKKITRPDTRHNMRSRSY